MESTRTYEDEEDRGAARVYQRNYFLPGEINKFNII